MVAPYNHTEASSPSTAPWDRTAKALEMIKNLRPGESVQSQSMQALFRFCHELLWIYGDDEKKVMTYFHSDQRKPKQLTPEDPVYDNVVAFLYELMRVSTAPGAIDDAVGASVVAGSPWEFVCPHMEALARGFAAKLLKDPNEKTGDRAAGEPLARPEAGR
jgi:hypothetical protein